MKYDFPKKNEWTCANDVVSWFSYYWQEKNGSKMPSKLWGRYMSLVRNKMKNNDYDYDDLRYLLWYVANTKPQMKSLGYLFYHWGELSEAKELKKEYDELQQNEKNKEREIKTSNKNKKTEEEKLKESKEKLLEDFC